MSDRNPLTVAEAEAIWDILTTEGGATSDHGFVHHQSTNFETEWRFMGHFGMGGKFRRNTGHRPDGTWGEIWYVDYYPEDRTAERDAIAKRINDLLRGLLSQREQTAS